MVRRLIPLEQVIEDSEREGKNTAHLLVDPEDVCEIDPDEILELRESEEG